MFLIQNGEAVTGLMLIILGVYWLASQQSGSRRGSIL